MSDFNFSYSTIDDVYATAEGERGKTREQLLALAMNLEQVGVGYYQGQEYRYRETEYGVEVVSVDDLALEGESDEDYLLEDSFHDSDYPRNNNSGPLGAF